MTRESFAIRGAHVKSTFSAVPPRISRPCPAEQWWASVELKNLLFSGSRNPDVADQTIFLGGFDECFVQTLG